MVFNVSPSWEKTELIKAIWSEVFPSAIQQARAEIAITSSQDSIELTSQKSMGKRIQIFPFSRGFKEMYPDRAGFCSSLLLSSYGRFLIR
jgi:hypothetical protein